jgi:uncharacterized membrane protein
MVRLPGRFLMAVGAALAVASPFVTHTALVTGRHRLLAAGFALCQMALGAAVAIRQRRGPLRTAVLVLIAGLAVFLAARLADPALLAEPGLIAASGLSHTLLYSGLLFLFAGSLRPGRTPLVSILARRIRGPLSLPVAAYTRHVTIVWCWFCVAQLAGSAMLFLMASHAAWSLFVNVLDTPLLATLFAGEYLMRRWCLPAEQHSPFMATLRSARAIHDQP